MPVPSEIDLYLFHQHCHQVVALQVNSEAGRANQLASPAVWVGLDNKKAAEKLNGLVKSDYVNYVRVFRKSAVQLVSKKIKQVNAPGSLQKTPLFAHLYIALASMISCLRNPPSHCVAISLTPHSLIAMVVSLLTQRPLVIWFIGTDLYVQLGRGMYGRLVNSLLKRRARHVLVMGSRSRERLVSLGWSSKDISIGYNAYNLDRYVPLNNEVKRYDLVFTGRIDREHKGLDVLLKALAGLRSNLSDFKCIIVGDGPDLKWLKTFSLKLGLSENLQFMGRTDDIPNVLQNSKVFVMASRWEGLPASLIEAFACGLPAVITKVGDVEDIAVDKLNSLLARSEDIEQIHALLYLVLTNHSLRERLSSSAEEIGAAIRREWLSKSIAAWNSALEIE